MNAVTAEQRRKDETAAWCRAAAAALCQPPVPWRESVQMVCAGIRLRRQWDLEDRDGGSRCELLRLLPAVEMLGRQVLIERTSAEADQRELSECVVGQIAEDEQYLGRLLSDPDLANRAVALALDGFRDDLYWLTIQVAILEGSQGIDFSSRVLTEQEAIQRELDGWEDGSGSIAAEAGDDSAVARAAESLRAALAELRQLALTRRVEALLVRPAPQGCRGWFSAWQSAGRLGTRLASEPAGSAPQSPAATAREAVERYRAEAAEHWARCVAELPPEESQAAFRQAVDELADTAVESMTFLEDVPLAMGVHTLEVLSEDTATCLAAIERSDGGRCKPLRRKLRRKQRAIAGELQDRRLAWRMESLIGRGGVAALERVIFALLALFIFMLVLESPLIHYEAGWRGIDPEQPGASGVEKVFAWMDLGICLVFLGEFALKLTLAQDRWLFFRRNWLTGLVPAIPVGFLAYGTHVLSVVAVEEGEWLVLLRALRYVRLPQMARWLRIARPALRMARLVGFVLVASDRLVRRLSPILNRNLVLFERASLEELETPHRARLSALRERFHNRTQEALAALPRRIRAELLRARVADLMAMLGLRHPGSAADGGASAAAAREIPFERMVAELLAATPAGVSERIGRPLAQSIARWCRAMDLPLLRRLPLVRDLVAASRLPNPCEATAQAANRIGMFLEGILERVYWFADLHGTVTAPQLVDSIGDWMVKGSARPTRRFLLFGALFVLLTQLASLLPSDTLNTLTHILERFVGTPLIVLGTLCMLPLLVGLWFRQIAGEATDFFTRVAEAQFIGATKDYKRRLAGRQREFLRRRVIAPELDVVQPGADDASAQSRPGGAEEAAAERERSVERHVETLWHDYLDGAPFHRNDTRTTMQLLGNLDLLSICYARLGCGRARRKRLRRLDLSGARGSLRGPYLWFHFISRSLAHQTARLVVDYDAFTLPLDRIATADAEQIRDYVAWLSRRLGRPIEALELPGTLGERYRDLPPQPIEAEHRREEDLRRRGFQGTDFTAIHFLSADPRLEAEIRGRYGDPVADLVRRDRRDNIRRVFRSYPFHHWPKERRTFNLLSFYQQHLLGGRVLWFPLTLAWWGLGCVGRLFRMLAAGVQEVLHPDAARLGGLKESDPYTVAVRKIHRMRVPLFMECLTMRAEFDPEYVGIILPGVRSRLATSATVPVDEDLASIRAEPAVRRQFAHLATERRRQVRELRDWLGPLGLASHSPESFRAMAIAYTCDYQKIRTRLEAARMLQRAFDEAIDDAKVAGIARPTRNWVRRLCGSSRRERGLDRLFSRPPFSQYTAPQQQLCRGLVRRRALLARAVRQLTGRAADPIEQARQTLASVCRDPAPWSRQLLTLRTVQTLSVLDLNTYCDLVEELGAYAAPSP